MNNMRIGYAIGIKAGNSDIIWRKLRTRYTGFIDADTENILKELNEDKDAIKSIISVVTKTKIEKDKCADSMAV